MSLPQRLRITRQDKMPSIFESGLVDKCGPFKIYTMPSDTTKLGVVVPKKCLVLSVDRQRLRRRLHADLKDLPLGQIMLVVKVISKISSEYDLAILHNYIQTKYTQAIEPLSA